MFDANVVVSAALSPNGVARQALIAARATGVVALSDDVFGEIADVLGRPKFARVLSEARRGEILEWLTAAAL